MKHFLAISTVSLTVLAANGPATAADSPALEKKNITIAVGGSISQMNKVAYFVALNRKYFEQECLSVECTLSQVSLIRRARNPSHGDPQPRAKGELAYI